MLSGARFEGAFPNTSVPDYEAIGECKDWLEYWNWSDERKEGLKGVIKAFMDTTQVRARLPNPSPELETDSVS
jgi:glucan 1,3-beta-glucosidase